MDYRLTWHCRDRMRDRGIDRVDIEAVLAGPSSTWHDSTQFSMTLTGTAPSGKELKVWIVGDVWPVEGMITVKSTAWS